MRSPLYIQPSSAENQGERFYRLLHDLRTPLNQIIGYSEMLVETAVEQGQLDFSEAFTEVRESAVELATMLQDRRELSLSSNPSSGFWPLHEASAPPIARIKSSLERALSGKLGGDLDGSASDLAKIRTATENFQKRVLSSQMMIRRPDPEPADAVEKGAREKATRHPTLKGRILIVDDEPMNRDMLARRLEREGCQPVGAEGGEEALALLHGEKFDAILLDIMMPGMSGMEVLGVLKDDMRTRDIPVIMLSALTEVDRVARCIELGAEDYLPKPINAILLRARLGACLEKKRFHDQEQSYVRALHAEKERLDVTLRSLADAVVATDADGRIVLFNKVATTITGLSPEQVMGWPFDQIFSIYYRADGKPAPNAAREALLHNTVFESAPGIAIRTADGSERMISTRSAPINDGQGHITGTVVVLHDITEREKMADELLRASKLQSIGVLAGGLAHDFNNMLTAVLGNLSLVRNRRDLPKELIPLTDEAERGALRARELTQYLLTFSEGGAPIKETVNPTNLIEETTAFGLRGSNIHAEFALSDDLWEIEADPNQLVQVISNLVINAVQASTEGGSIFVSSENLSIPPDSAANLSDGSYIRISIRDWGCGIEPDHLHRIYDPFFTTKKQARGLGLAAAYSIIQRHEGQIEVFSTVGEGTTVHFYLPAIRRQAPQPKAAPVPARAPVLPPQEIAPASDSEKLTVLVMDDEEPIRSVASTMLEMLGYKVVTAADGEEAVNLHAEALRSGKPFDYFISDLTVPGGMGGRDAIRLIREKDQKIVAIVSSGYSNDPVMAHYQDYGFNGVLPKPYMFADMAGLLQQLSPV